MKIITTSILYCLLFCLKICILFLGSTAASRETHQGGVKERFDVSHLSEGITANDLEQVCVLI